MNLLTITLKNLWHRKIRTGLTILGVGISIAAFVSLVGLANNLAESLRTTLKSRGTDLVVLEKGIVDIFSGTLDEKYLEKIKQIPGVLDVSAILVKFYAIGSNRYMLVYGWQSDSYLFDELKITGSPPKNENELIMGVNAAERLKKKIGDKMRITDTLFIIVGIFQSKSIFEEGAIIIPLNKLQMMKNSSQMVTMFNVKVSRENIQGNDVNKAIENVQNRIQNQFPDVEVKNIQGFVSTDNPLLTALKFTWAISIVAFLIAILGIVNTMTTSVVERTQEIGILLAIGWRNVKVIILVLWESTLLGFLGGLFGLCIGYLMMKVLLTSTNLQGLMKMEYDFVFMVKAMIISVLLGFLSGIYPAVKAISIEPIKVLRYE